MLLQFILYYASSGALTSDQRWLLRVANDEQYEGQIRCFCSVQVCSVLRSLFLRIGVVYGISNFTNGVGHAEVRDVPIILVLHVNFPQLSLSRWRIQHLDAETGRQFELHCDLVSERHTPPC